MRICTDTQNAIDDRELVHLNCSRLQEIMQESAVDAVFVIAPDNWRYVTGLPVHHCLYFATVNAALLTREAAMPTIFALDFFCVGMKGRAPWFQDVVELPMTGTREALQPLGVGAWPGIIAKKINKLRLSSATIAVDPGTPYVIKDRLQERLPKARFLDAAQLLRQARLVKNKEEIKAMRNACISAEIAMEDAFRIIREGVTELEISAAVESSFRIHGAEYPTFQPLIISGLNPFLGYMNPSSRVIRYGDLVRLDIGCCCDGYNSCFARTVFVGEADRSLEDDYAAVHASLQAGIAATRPGVTNTSIYNVIADTLSERSAGKYTLGWYGGHGLGTGIHEDPMIGATGSVDEVTLEPGMCIAIEPSAIIPDRGWLGLEDNVVVTAMGCEVLTRTRFSLYAQMSRVHLPSRLVK